MFGLGAGEILIILVIALLFIGPKKLPELAKNLGKGVRDFQNAIKGITDPEETYKPPVLTKDQEEEIRKTDHAAGDDTGDDVITATVSKKVDFDEIREEVKKEKEEEMKNKEEKKES